MRTVKDHVCFLQDLEQAGANKKEILASLRKCRCRKMLSRADATKLVQSGEAQWVILDRRPVLQDAVCHICAGGDAKPNCQHCKGFGICTEVFYVNSFSDEHIVRVNIACKDEKGREIFSPVTAKQTPRVATIEQSHIERAYASDNETASLAERKRIELYGFMTLMARLVIGAGKLLVPIGVEPEDNAEEGTGRRYDWGRSVFSINKDERSGGSR